MPRKRNNRVELWYRTIPLNNQGMIDKNAKYVFTMGHCHSLAMALNQKMDWPIYSLANSFSPRETPSHFVVYSPELKEYIDIEGVGADRRWPNLTISDTPYTLKEMKSLECYLKPRIRIAKPFADAVIKKVTESVIPQVAK